LQHCIDAHSVKFAGGGASGLARRSKEDESRH
jgi:hypothetical protein